MTDVPQPGLDAGREALRRFLAGEDDLAVMHTKIAVIATETVPGCDMASITTLRGGKPTTPAFTGKFALLLDETQYKLRAIAAEIVDRHTHAGGCSYRRVVLPH